MITPHLCEININTNRNKIGKRNIIFAMNFELLANKMAVRIKFISCRTRSEIRKLVCGNFKCISKESLHNLNDDSWKVASVALRFS